MEAGFVGMSLRHYNPTTQKWAIYWVDSKNRTMESPAIGSFESDTGTFEGDDFHQGIPIRIRFTWSKISADHARWQQAFSIDHGKTWETNWVIDHHRVN